MGQLHSALGGALLIGGLVAGAAWYARFSDRGPPPQVFFSAASPPENDSLPLRFGRLEWGTDGEMTLLSYGCTSDLGLTLCDVPQNARRIVADAGLGAVSAARLSADGRHVLMATQTGALWWIDSNSPDSRVQLAELPPTQLFRSLAISASSEWIAAGSTAGAIQICGPAQAGSVGHRIEAGSGVVDVQFSRDGLRLGSAHSDGSVRVWEVATGKSVAEFAGHDRGALAAAFLPDGERIISAGADDTLRMWDITSGNELRRQEAEFLGARSLAVSADGLLAAWGGHDHCIVVWDIDRDGSKFEIFTTASSVSHLHFSPDGSLLAAVETDAEKSVRLYDMQHGNLVRRISMEGEDIP